MFWLKSHHPTTRRVFWRSIRIFSFHRHTYISRNNNKNNNNKKKINNNKGASDPDDFFPLYVRDTQNPSDFECFFSIPVQPHSENKAMKNVYFNRQGGKAQFETIELFNLGYIFSLRCMRFSPYGTTNATAINIYKKKISRKYLSLVRSTHSPIHVIHIQLKLIKNK